MEYKYSEAYTTSLGSDPDTHLTVSKSGAGVGGGTHRAKDKSTTTPKSKSKKPSTTTREKREKEKEREEEPLFIHTFQNPGDTIQAPNIPFESLVLGTKLGSGTFGTVYKGSCRGTVVAIKILRVTSVNQEDILQEVGMMSHLRFQNIVTMHGVCFHEDNLYIISEYLPCGDLEHWLSDKDKEISYIPKLKILKDVAMGMNWLHSSDPSVIHRDLKPANVLLTTSRRPGDEETIVKEKRVKEIERDLMAKVTDMGLSKVMTKQLKADGAGSNLWMAPELLKYQYYDEKVDVYSFALLMWQVLTWTRNPFQDYLDRGDLDVFVEAVYHHHVRPDIPKGTHPKLIELMEAGWTHFAKDRPDFTIIAMGLDDCLITTLFKDERYASFWKKNWGARVLRQEKRVEPAKEIIPFPVFVEAFYDYLSHYGVIYPENPESDVYYLCLKVMIIDPKVDAVTIERLLLIEKWFGPLVEETWPPSPKGPPKSPRRSARGSNPGIPLSTTNLPRTSTGNGLSQNGGAEPVSPRKSSRMKKETSKQDVKEPRETQKTIPKTPVKSHLGTEGQVSPRSPRSPQDKSPRSQNDEHLHRGHSSSAIRTKNSRGISETSPHADPITRSDSGKSVSGKNVQKQKTKSKLPKFSVAKDSNERPEERTLLGTLKRILEQPWFHGDISKEDADSSLATNRMQEGRKIFGPHGDFLIRLSLSEPVEKHPFTITKVDKKGVIFHQRIFHDEENRFYRVFTKNSTVPEIVSDTLIGLVKQLVDTQMVHKPCKRWNYARKYDDIFQQKELHDKGYLDQGYLDQ